MKDIPIPSPYNAATGAVREEAAARARRAALAPFATRPPLLPLWRVAYTVPPESPGGSHAHGTIYLRAVDIAELKRELERLHTRTIRYMVWAVCSTSARAEKLSASPVHGETDTVSEGEAHGHPGVPPPPA